MNYPLALPETLLPTPIGALRVGPARMRRSQRLQLSIVLPTYNEAANIGELIRELTGLLARSSIGEYEIIVVDDNSPDRTWEIARSLPVQGSILRVMRRNRERGLSSAVIRGWQAARGEVLAVMDADLQHDPQVVLALWEQISRGADLALASRHIQSGGVSEWNLFRRALSRAAQLFGLVVLPAVVGRVSDPMSGYFMLRRRCIEGVELKPLGYKVLLEVLARGRVSWIGEVPYVFRERADGRSKANWRIYIAGLYHLLRLRFADLPGNRFVRFALVGLSGAIVDMGVLFLLSDPSMLGWGLTRGKLIAGELAIVNNFSWNDRWTFGDVSAKSTRQARLRRFAKFQLICLAGLILNTLLLNIQFNLLGINRYVANAVAIVCVTLWNFWLNLKMSWRLAPG
jgi:dolichol-phosphate mannosyltransferase